ncbi:hypothetical protein Btru_053426 [Bulinus truncatus]|nr:hypothetical protein Btru_053426 [Bulinus truncatus]
MSRMIYTGAPRLALSNGPITLAPDEFLLTFWCSYIFLLSPNKLQPDHLTMDNVSSTDILANQQGPEQMLAAEVVILLYIIDGVITGLVTFLGVVFNIINAIVYVKMGRGDPVNITLLALSLAELGASSVLLIMSFFTLPDLSMRYLAVAYLISWIHISFSRISSCLTAFVTLERYLCVALPLKVKTLITSGRTTAVVILIYIGMTASMVPPYFARKIEPTVMPDTNETIMMFVFREAQSQGMEKISVMTNNIALLVAFAVVFVSTLMIVVNLHNQTKWRNTALSTGKNDFTSTRDNRVVKMITLIAGIFILSYLPVVVSTAAMLCFPEYSVEGRYSQLFTLIWGFNFLLEGINAMASMLVYLKMSSKYKAVFWSLFNYKTKAEKRKLK